MYRASISKLKDFDCVSLGEGYENAAKSFLDSESDNHNFEIIIQKRISDIYRSIDKIILSFGKFKLDGINCYDLFLSGYRIIIKVDQRAFSKKLNFLSIRPEGIIMLHQKLEESKDGEFIRNSIKNHFTKKNITQNAL